MPDMTSKCGTESWNTGRRDVTLMAAVKGDAVVWLAIGDHGGDAGEAVELEPGQARSIGYGLLRRAELIDPASPRKASGVPATPTGIITEFLSQTRELSRRILAVDAEHKHLIRHLCDEFAVIALMAALENAVPDVAAEVAERLADVWEDGGSIDEFLYEWRGKHAAGQPIGFNPPPTLPLDVARIE